ncbi:MAG: CYTH domain-containing protein [Phascolarctobacterium sp.]|nr:CYTH domain-containing protein [Phascolarctobacterium sp.]
MANNTEIELKLLISKENLKKMLALDFVVAAMREGSCQKRKLISSYYDTEDLAFKRNGIAYRVRSKGDGTYEATVKTTLKNSAGLSERLELNLPLTNSRPKLEGFAELGLGYELSELAPQGINKLFTVNVQRTTYILDIEGAVAELAIDHGRISTGKSGDPMDAIDEIEIELLEGDKGALLAFAAKIAEQVPLFVEKRSKFVRGLALRGIASDIKATNAKLGSGVLKEELLMQVAQHGEVLLDLQKQLLEQAELLRESTELLGGKLLKGIYKELLTLRTLNKLAGVSVADCLNIAMLKVERLRTLYALWQLQAEITAQASERYELKRANLGKKLTALVQNMLNELVEFAQNGRFTTIVYGINSAVYQAELEEKGAELAARELLKQWQKSLARLDAIGEAIETDKNNSEQLKSSVNESTALIMLEDIWALARLGEGKAFTKALDNVKKLRRAVLKAAEFEAWQNILASICAESTSKLVYRDAGILLGYLLAKS